jgi:uncharacterized protein (DUF488 family)
VKEAAEKVIEIFTIGHSNISSEEFLCLLKKHEISLAADIRRYPGSRKFPHFNREILCKTLTAEGIEYRWLEALGGRRGSIKNSESPNKGLKSASFRNYADYMLTDEFSRAVKELISMAMMKRCAVMCAEKLYWKCHRRLLSDYLVVQGIKVMHILEADKAAEHKLTPFAVVTSSDVITYPPQADDDTNLKTLFK